MINEKLASHLSARLWISKDKIEEVLGDFNEVPEPIVEMPVKHRIELVNEKYPNGWYCYAFEEVREDIMQNVPIEERDCFAYTLKYWGYDGNIFFNGYNADNSIFNECELITREEYLAITRGVEEWKLKVGEWFYGFKKELWEVSDINLGEGTVFGTHSNSKSIVPFKINEIKKWTPEKGQDVEVSNDGEEWYSPREFLNYTSYSEFPYEVKINSCANGNYKYIRPYIAKPTTVEQPTPQRDYTGIRFKFKRTDGSIGDKIFTLRKTNEKDYYTAAEKGKLGNCWRSVIVEEFFKFGTWIEVKEETPIKQSPLVQPKDPLNLFDMNKRIEALEAAILPTKKNLSTDTPTIDWKKVECLSWNDVKYFIEGYLTTVEKIIKNKLKK